MHPYEACLLDDRSSVALQESIDAYNQSPEAKQWNSPATDEEVHRRELRACVAALRDPTGTVVDVGPGRGLIPHALALLGHQVYTVESPQFATSSAVDRLSRLGVKGLFAHVGSDPVPLESGTVDLVFCADVLEHVVHSPRPFLTELMRLLKPGGYLIVVTPNAIRLLTRVKVAAGYSNWPPVEDFFDAEYHVGHHKEYTPEELTHVLERVGLAQVSIEFVENRIGTTPLTGLADVKSQNRFGRDFGEPGPIGGLPITVARRLALAVVRVRPHLASEMIACGRRSF